MVSRNIFFEYITGNYENALKTFKKVLNASHLDSQYMYVTAGVYQQANIYKYSQEAKYYNGNFYPATNWNIDYSDIHFLYDKILKNKYKNSRKEDLKNSYYSKSFFNEPYSRLWTWLSRSKLGDEDKANKQLRKYLKRRGQKNDWYETLCLTLLKDISDDQLSSEAKKESELINEKLCETYFYLAQLQLIDNNISQAKALLRKCISTNQKKMVEYIGARIQLASLNNSQHI